MVTIKVKCRYLKTLITKNDYNKMTLTKDGSLVADFGNSKN